MYSVFNKPEEVKKNARVRDTEWTGDRRPKISPQLDQPTQGAIWT